MPMAAPRPCVHPRCRKMAVKDGRCEEHKIKHGWKHTKSRHERGYDAKWYKLRARIMERDEHLCQTCLKDNIYTPASQVDHITPKFKGGTDDPSNLQAICKKCHDKKTRLEAQEARNG